MFKLPFPFLSGEGGPLLNVHAEIDGIAYLVGRRQQRVVFVDYTCAEAGDIGNLDVDIMQRANGDYCVLELNPRFGGGFPFSYEAGVNLPKHKKVIITVNDADKHDAISIGQRFEKLGYEVYATRSTAKVLQQNGVNAIKVNKLSQESPTVIDLLLEHKIDIVVDTPTQGRDKTRDGFLIRRISIETGVNCFTSLDTVNALLTSLESNVKDNLTLIDIATVNTR